MFHGIYFCKIKYLYFLFPSLLILDFQLNITDFLESLHLPVIDVRSPAEFERGHPGAYNMLLSNEERSLSAFTCRKVLPKP
jgi:hypothetical protein